MDSDLTGFNLLPDEEESEIKNFLLTDNELSDYDPQISNNNVVWSVYDGNDSEIYLYDGSSIIQRTDNETYDSNPQISGNNIVWVGDDGNDSEIYLYDGSSIIQLTDNETYDSNPRISGNNVVWSNYPNYRDRNSHIYLYDGSSTIQLTDNDADDLNPKISGNKVVWSSSNYGSDSEIYLYDGNNIAQLTDNDTNDYNPQISGNNVVWQGYDSTDEEIYLHNGSSIIQLTDNNISDFSPQISGNNIVWVGDDGNDSEIYLYDGSNIIQLTDNDTDDLNPQISGNKVVWSNYPLDRYGDSHIYLYDGSRTTKLTENDTDNSHPHISGNRVVWSGDDGNDAEIYLNLTLDKGIRIEAEDYQEYFDTTPGNNGGVYRNDDVDLESTSDIGGGFNVSWFAEGEWLTYDVDIPKDGIYQLVARVASKLDQPHRLDVSLEEQVTTLSFQGTDGWQSWSNVSSDGINLTAGSHELRLDMGSGFFNFNYIDVIPYVESPLWE